jgi:Rrf2 family protein
MLHILLHMARFEDPVTSEQIAKMLGTNAVVVRRTMAGLKKAGYVSSEKGHGGGWRISAKLENINLLDVHQAVGGPHIFAIGNFNAEPDCAVERIVNGALGNALRDAERLLLERLRQVTLADLIGDFDAICASSGWDLAHIVD